MNKGQVVPRVAIVTDLMKNHGGRFVTTKHIDKKGQVRTINGRFGVTKGTTGSGLRHDPATHGQDTIAEMIRDEKGRFSGFQYRTVNFNTLQLAKFNGKILVALEASVY